MPRGFLLAAAFASVFLSAKLLANTPTKLTKRVALAGWSGLVRSLCRGEIESPLKVTFAKVVRSMDAKAPTLVARASIQINNSIALKQIQILKHGEEFSFVYPAEVRYVDEENNLFKKYVEIILEQLYKEACHSDNATQTYIHPQAASRPAPEATDVVFDHNEDREPPILLASASVTFNYVLTLDGINILSSIPFTRIELSFHKDSFPFVEISPDLQTSVKTLVWNRYLASGTKKIFAKSAEFR